MKRLLATLVSIAAVLAQASPAGAWGTTGHRTIGLVAVRALPEDVPAFVTTAQAQATIEALGTEMDQLKGAGYSWDRDYDPGHYVNIGDDHKIAGVVSLNALPRDMRGYATALSAANKDPYTEGYLPYTIADGWEQLRKDFAYWRVFDYLVMHGKPGERASFAAARALREQIVIHDIGIWSHFVGDGSQPLHTSVHYNDHGIHARFEGAFVRDHVTVEAVAALVPQGGPRDARQLVDQRELLAEVGEYLSETNAKTDALYAIEKRGGFRSGSVEAVTFVTARVADGARELRDLIVEAYDNSLYESVGYPELPVRDILEGRVMPLPSAFGGD